MKTTQTQAAPAAFLTLVLTLSMPCAAAADAPACVGRSPDEDRTMTVEGEWGPQVNYAEGDRLWLSGWHVRESRPLPIECLSPTEDVTARECYPVSPDEPRYETLGKVEPSELRYLATLVYDGYARQAKQVIGSTGAIDEVGLNRFKTTGLDLHFRNDRAGTIIARYPLPCEKWYTSDRPHLVQIGYKDDGPGARVEIYTVSTNVLTGEVDRALYFDSDTVSGFDGTTILTVEAFRHWQTTHLLCPIHGEQIFHFEVRLHKGQHGGDPRFRHLRLVTLDETGLDDFTRYLDRSPVQPPRAPCP